MNVLIVLVELSNWMAIDATAMPLAATSIAKIVERILQATMGARLRLKVFVVAARLTVQNAH
jgi:hypothetical protein